MAGSTCTQRQATNMSKLMNVGEHPCSRKTADQPTTWGRQCQPVWEILAQLHFFFSLRRKNVKDYNFPPACRLIVFNTLTALHAPWWRVLTWEGGAWRGLANCESSVQWVRECQVPVSLNWYKCVKPPSLVSFPSAWHLSMSAGLHRTHLGFVWNLPTVTAHHERGYLIASLLVCTAHVASESWEVRNKVRSVSLNPGVG